MTKIVNKLEGVKVLLGSEPCRDRIGFYYILNPFHFDGLTVRYHCIYFL
jgi:hypothetical protein